MIEMVKFKDGKYGIRKYSNLDSDYLFLGMENPYDHLWFFRGGIKHSCKGEYEFVKEAFKQFKIDIGEPVDE